MVDSTRTLSRSRTTVQRPHMWTCKFFNDDYTPTDFVIQILMDIYHQTQTDAVTLTLKIHRSGSANVGIYPKDIAELKAYQTISNARRNDYPLHVQAEKVPT